MHIDPSLLFYACRQPCLPRSLTCYASSPQPRICHAFCRSSLYALVRVGLVSKRWEMKGKKRKGREWKEGKEKEKDREVILRKEREMLGCAAREKRHVIKEGKRRTTHKERPGWKILTWLTKPLNLQVDGHKQKVDNYSGRPHGRRYGFIGN